MTISKPQHHGPDVGTHPEDGTTAAQAPARVVLLDNRDSFVYNLVDQFATLGSRIQVYRNNVPASRVLAALEPTEAERQAATAAGTGYASTSDEPVEGSLASDEALQALREKLTGSN